jgi:uncharacterized protein YqeY
MTLSERIDDDLIKALKAGEKARVTLLRGLKSDIKYKLIEKGEELTDDDLIGVLNSAAKRRRDSIDQFRAGKRMDLVEKEASELEIIQSYLPEQLTEDKIKELIKSSIEATGADSPAKLGLVMKDLMPKIKGKADGKLVNRFVSEMLSGESS